MTRRGKIARLPRAIREELNQRLENGEQGARLVEWLNELPEVKAVLTQDFEGQPITECNLTAWRNGGFLDWQAQLKAESMVERWQEDSPMFEVHPPSSDYGATSSPKSEKISAALTERLMVHYAAALEDAIIGSDEKALKHVERLEQSLREVVRVRRYQLAQEQARERADVGREWVALERERLELLKARVKNPKPGAEPEKTPRPSHEEKAEMVRRMLEEA